MNINPFQSLVVSLPSLLLILIVIGCKESSSDISSQLSELRKEQTRLKQENASLRTEVNNMKKEFTTEKLSAGSIKVKGGLLGDNVEIAPYGIYLRTSSEKDKGEYAMLKADALKFGDEVHWSNSHDGSWISLSLDRGYAGINVQDRKKGYKTELYPSRVWDYADSLVVIEKPANNRGAFIIKNKLAAFIVKIESLEAYGKASRLRLLICNTSSVTFSGGEGRIEFDTTDDSSSEAYESFSVNTSLLPGIWVRAEVVLEASPDTIRLLKIPFFITDKANISGP